MHNLIQSMILREPQWLPYKKSLLELYGSELYYIVASGMITTIKTVQISNCLMHILVSLMCSHCNVNMGMGACLLCNL